jgi:uncharacterized protein
MLRAVLDTNVLVSGLLSRNGPPARIFDAWREGYFVLLTSPIILEEVWSVLHYPRIQQRYTLADGDIEELMDLLAHEALILPGKIDVRGSLPADPDDEIFLACALEGEAQAIVSGDHHLLDLGAYHGIPVLSASQFLEVIPKKN